MQMSEEQVRVRLTEWSVTLDQTAADALEIMRAEDLSFVPVTAPATGKFLGIVLRRALERGCVGMGHDAQKCPLQHHLKTDVRFVFASDEPDRDAVRAAASQPVVVVDAALVPVGVLEAAA